MLGTNHGASVNNPFISFSGNFLCLRQEGPKEQRIREIGNAEENEEFPADGRKCHGRGLPNHCVEGKGRHSCDPDTF